MAGVPVAVYINRTGRFEYPLHLPQPRIKPAQVGKHAVLKNIVKTAHLVIVTPNLRVGAIAEKWRVDINQFYLS